MTPFIKKTHNNFKNDSWARSWRAYGHDHNKFWFLLCRQQVDKPAGSVNMFLILVFLAASYTLHYNSLELIRTVHFWRINYRLNILWSFCYNLNHHHISVMELGHLLTRSGLRYPEVSSKVCHDPFCQLGNSVSLPWVIYCKALYLHVVSSFSRIPVICLKLVLLLIPFAICVFVL